MTQLSAEIQVGPLATDGILRVPWRSGEEKSVAVDGLVATQISDLPEIP
jgi:hypothetical protein